MSARNYTVLVPCARLLCPEMQVEFGPVPPGLVPLNGRTVLEHIADGFAGQGLLGVRVGLHEGAEVVEEHFARRPHPALTLDRLAATRSLSDTVLQLLRRLPDAPGAVLVNLGDTLVRDLPADAVGLDFASSAAADETQRWTLFKAERGHITELSDKVYRPDPEGWRAFTGLWGFAEPARLRKLLEEEHAADPAAGYYRALRRYVEGSPDYRFIETAQWIDCGHADNYYRARRRLIRPRYFNTLGVGDNPASVRKTSSNTRKLIDEVHWYLALPRELRYFVPAIHDYSTDPLAPMIEMEFYGYPTLDDCFVYGRFDFDAWDKAFHRLFDVLAAASRYQVRAPDLRADLEEMYCTKTITRLREHLAQAGAQSLDPAVADNLAAASIRSVEQLILALPDLIERAGLLRAECFQVIHGDFCFSNILYDAKHGLVKLIDPRGRFGRYEIHGDVRYDLAKLSHSVLGHYDLILADQFRAAPGETRLSPQATRVSDYHATIGSIFRRHVARAGFDLRAVRLVEALLFLSMPPLHRDHPARQRVMWLRGLELLRQHLEAV